LNYSSTTIAAVASPASPGSPPTNKIEENDYPRIWLDTDIERDPRPSGLEKGILNALLAADPRAPIKPTGQTRNMFAWKGGDRSAVEVEIQLSEDEIAHCCYYCGVLQVRDDRFKKVGGREYTSIYSCSRVRQVLLY
jgi:hypothetical protein